MLTVGTMLKRLRRERGLTLESLAASAGCTKGYLSQIENGKRSRPPSGALVRRLESALGVTDGSLRRAAAWDQTPPQVRAEMKEMHEELRRVRGRLGDREFRSPSFLVED